MSQFRETAYVPCIAAGAIGKYDRVRITGKDANGGFTVAQAGLAERTDGIAQNAAFAAGDEVGVALLNKPGTHKVRVNEAVAFGATLYTEAGGEYQDTAAATSFPEMKALEAATAEDDIIEALVLPPQPVAAT